MMKVPSHYWARIASIYSIIWAAALAFAAWRWGT
jgi:hypothetical protein